MSFFMTFILIFLDYFFIIFHTVFILFNLTGWMFRKTRKIHFATMLLTFFSWFILGIWFGWGYCFCTDWHWKVRTALGYANGSRSYIHFLLNMILGVNLNENLVINLTLFCFALCLALSILLNTKDFISRRKNGQ